MSDDIPKTMKSNVRKRPLSDRRPAWKNQPAFMDASASISVATFGARRLPEVQQLYDVATSQQPLQSEDSALKSGGGKTSSRHLRRRTTSHQSHHRHRFPQGDGGKITEIRSMTRKSKRSKKEHLCDGHFQWKKTGVELKCVESDFHAKSGKVNWMTTHLWHAKRFHMSTLWDWRVPLVHTNRGGRAILRLSLTHCTLQDLTYERQPLFIKLADGCSKEDILQCLSLILPSIGTDEMILSRLRKDEICMGESFLHERGQFPKGAIGPVWWQILPGCVRLFLHPSIWTKGVECLKELRIQFPSIFDSNGSADRKNQIPCCLRLCGDNSEAILKNALNNLGVCTSLSILDSAHGDIFSVPVTSHLKNETLNLLLVRQCPRPLNCAANRAVAGVEIYCPPEYASILWQELCHKSVVLGLVERAYLCLECDPPIPQFPRDFVETEEAQKYWMHWNQGSMSNPWSQVRFACENGWGRIPVFKNKLLSKIDWNELVKVNKKNNTNTISLVAVQGNFGHPFINVINQCGHPIVSCRSRKNKNYKKRRPSQNVRCIQAKDKQHNDEWRQAVCGLFDHLSLPAVLRINISVLGKGTVQSGDKIIFGNVVIGFVTSGGFSPSRGCSHGLGVIGAARFLEGFKESEEPSNLVRRVQSGTQSQKRVLAALERANRKTLDAMTFYLML